MKKATFILNEGFDKDLIRGYISICIYNGFSHLFFLLENWEADKDKLCDLVKEMRSSNFDNVLIEVVTEYKDRDKVRCFDKYNILSRDLSFNDIQFLSNTKNTFIMCQVNDVTYDKVYNVYSNISESFKKRIKIYPYTILPHTSQFRPELQDPVKIKNIKELVNKFKTSVSDLEPPKQTIAINLINDQVFDVLNYTEILPVTDDNISYIIKQYDTLRIG